MNNKFRDETKKSYRESYQFAKMIEEDRYIYDNIYIDVSALKLINMTS